MLGVSFISLKHDKFILFASKPGINNGMGYYIQLILSCLKLNFLNLRVS